MEFDYSERTMQLAARLTAFMDEHVLPNEGRYYEEVRAGKLWPSVVEELKPKARAQGPSSAVRPGANRSSRPLPSRS